jgi:hypothetical protein
VVYFVDIDGTIVRHGTNEFLPGALDWLQGLCAAGSDIVFTTRRGCEFVGHPIYSEQGLSLLLNDLYIRGIKWHSVVKNIGSPRVIVNDEECSAIRRETNQAWDAATTP